MKSFCKLLLAAVVCLGFAAESYADYPSGLSKRSVRKLERAKKNKKPTASAPLSTYCKSTSPISALLKNAYPGHISLNDPRATGFALVCNNRDCPSKFPAEAYYSDGTPAFKLGYYGTWEGNGRPRAYCGAGGVGRCSVSKVTSDSKKSGRDGKVYIVFNKNSKSCRSAVPGKRNGSPF